MSFKGIDVSVWQGKIDFRKVKACGMDFVIIRAGYGNGHRDRKFEVNYQNAKAAGLHVGAYWYSYATSAEGAMKEAQSCEKVLRGKQFDYPVYFDIEEKSQLSRGKDFCSSLVAAFCGEMERNGYYAGVYASLSTLVTLLSEAVRKKYTIWVAQWSGGCSYKDAGMWQYSSKGRMSGIKGDIDMDIAYVDFSKVIVLGGYNGYRRVSGAASDSGSGTEASAQKNGKSIEELAREVIQGRWGNGAARKRKLTAAGYDAAAVQRKVNEMLR